MSFPGPVFCVCCPVLSGFLVLSTGGKACWPLFLSICGGGEKNEGLWREPGPSRPSEHSASSVTPAGGPRPQWAWCSQAVTGRPSQLLLGLP